MTKAPQRGVALFLSAMSFCLASCAPVEQALDPNCTPEKAARNAAAQASVGIPANRCTPGETARDVTGTDGAADEVRDRLP